MMWNCACIFVFTVGSCRWLHKPWLQRYLSSKFLSRTTIWVPIRNWCGKIPANEDTMSVQIQRDELPEDAAARFCDGPGNSFRGPCELDAENCQVLTCSSQPCSDFFARACKKHVTGLAEQLKFRRWTLGDTKWGTLWN